MTTHLLANRSPEADSARRSFDSWLARVVATRDDWTPAMLRLVLGAVMLPHGAQKAFGWFGGPGLTGTLAYFRDALSIPAPLTLLVVLAELGGGVALVAGFLTRLAALGVGAVMVGAAVMVHASNGFFMNWFGNQPGEGFEYHLLALALAAGLVAAGGGKGSIDARLARPRSG